MDSNKLLSRVEVARMINVSISSIVRADKAGKLRSIHIGRRVLYKYEDIINYIDKCQTVEI